MEEGSSASNILTIKPTGRMTLGRLRCRWEATIRKDFKEIDVITRNLLDLFQDGNY